MPNTYFHISAQAGAGTGKTYSLVENYLEALFGTDLSGQKKRPDQILALTFTEKAANEMRLRVASRLNSLILNTKDQDPEELRRLLRALPNAHIATFHSFCADLLRKEARHLKINENFQLLLPKEEEALAKNILRPLILEGIKKPQPLIRSLVARFRLSSGPLSLGLIDSLYNCYQKLFEQGLRIENLGAKINKSALSAIFLNKDLQKIRAALANFYEKSPNAKTKERLDELSKLISQPFCLDDEAKLAKKLAEIKDSIKGNFGDLSSRQELVLAVNGMIANLIDHLMADDEEALVGLLNDFDQHFKACKSALAKLGYGDLLIEARGALARDPHLRKRWKKRYLHILIDEYQDTSPIQEDIISYLAENKEHEELLAPKDRPLWALDFRLGSSLFVVGDKKQSIYNFRGANTLLFDDIVKKMASTHQDSLAYTNKLLTTNRRSAASIIKLVNLVSRHTLKEQGYEESSDLVPALDDHGYRELWLSSDDQSRDPTTANLYTAAHGVAQILNCKEEARDIVILVRRMRSGVALKGILSTLGIASRIVGGEGFFQQQEIIDLLSALKLLSDPHNEFAMAVVLRSPLVLLPDQDLMTIHSLNEDGRLSLNNVLLYSTEESLKPDARKRLITFLECIDEMRLHIKERGLAWALDLLIEKADLAFYCGLLDNSEQKWANINKLRSILAGTKANPIVVIDEFYNYIFNNQKEAQALEKSDSNSALTIMTIHQSKGLEFKTVILADTEAALPPNSSDILGHVERGLVLRPKGRPIAFLASKLGSDEQSQTRFAKTSCQIREAEQAEMARLLYVALTRACSNLYIVSSQTSFLNSRLSTKSLVDLFLRAYHQEQQAFLSLCPIKEINENQSPNWLAKDPVLIKQIQPQFQWQKTNTRLFASQLLVPDEWSFNKIKPSLKPQSKVVDGNLAHQLLAMAGPMLTKFMVSDEDSIEKLLDASFRAYGPYADLYKAKNTKQACLNTLLTLHQDLKSAIKIIFEQAIFCRANSNILIEGFADLVLYFDNFIGVIEFKSSPSLVSSPKTYLQLLAYAHGLATNNNNLPLKYAAVLIGSKELISWLPYDKYSQEAFLKAISEQR